MDSKQIDELFKVFINSDVNKFIEISGVDVTPKELEEKEDVYDKTMEIVMKKIEQGDYDYFYSLYTNNQDKNHKEFVCSFLCFSTRVKDIINVIEQQEQQEKPDLDSDLIRDLIKATKNSEFIKGIIEDEDRRIKLGINYASNISDLIAAIGDSKYIKGIIEDENRRIKLGINYSFSISDLIIATGDPEYIKGIIEDEDRRINLGIYDESSSISNLIVATGDPEYIKGIIENKKKREEFDFSPNIIEKLIRATKDSEFIKGIIESKEKQQELGLNDSMIKNLIPRLRKKHRAELIDKKDELELSPSVLKRLIAMTKDKQYIEKYLKSIETKQDIASSNTSVDLPPNMTIGIEIESEGENSELISRLTDKFYRGWTCKGDGSLTNGVEVVSPILTGDTSKTTEQIRNVCGRLTRLRTNSVQKMWRTYTYWSRLFNNRRKLEKFS